MIVIPLAHCRLIVFYISLLHRLCKHSTNGSGVHSLRLTWCVKLLSIVLHPLIQLTTARRKKSNESPCQTAYIDILWQHLYSEFPITTWEVVACAERPPLSGAICWLMLTTQIRSRMTTTRSSRTLSSPQSEGFVSRGLADDEDTESRGGEEMDTTVPTQHRTTLKKNSHTSPPMVLRLRTRSCRSTGVSNK